MLNVQGQYIRLASLSILQIEHIPDVYKLITLYLIDSIDCFPGPCWNFKYQSEDKLIDFFTYLCILVYLWPKIGNFRWLLTAALFFRLIGIWQFFRTGDESVLVQFPDYFRELSIVHLLFPGNIWWIIAVLVLKPFVEIFMHVKHQSLI